MLLMQTPPKIRLFLSSEFALECQRAGAGSRIQRFWSPAAGCSETKSFSRPVLGAGSSWWEALGGQRHRLASGHRRRMLQQGKDWLKCSVCCHLEILPAAQQTRCPTSLAAQVGSEPLESDCPLPRASVQGTLGPGLPPAAWSWGIAPGAGLHQGSPAGLHGGAGGCRILTHPKVH